MHGSLTRKCPVPPITPSYCCTYDALYCYIQCSVPCQQQNAICCLRSRLALQYRLQKRSALANSGFERDSKACGTRLSRGIGKTRENLSISSFVFGSGRFRPLLAHYRRRCKNTLSARCASTTITLLLSNSNVLLWYIVPRAASREDVIGSSVRGYVAIDIGAYG